MLALKGGERTILTYHIIGRVVTLGSSHSYAANYPFGRQKSGIPAHPLSRLTTGLSKRCGRDC